MSTACEYKIDEDDVAFQSGLNCLHSVAKRSFKRLVSEKSRHAVKARVRGHPGRDI